MQTTNLGITKSHAPRKGWLVDPSHLGEMVVFVLKMLERFQRVKTLELGHVVFTSDENMQPSVWPLLRMASKSMPNLKTLKLGMDHTQMISVYVDPVRLVSTLDKLPNLRELLLSPGLINYPPVRPHVSMSGKAKARSNA